MVMSSSGTLRLTNVSGGVISLTGSLSTSNWSFTTSSNTADGTVSGCSYLNIALAILTSGSLTADDADLWCGRAVVSSSDRALIGFTRIQSEVSESAGVAVSISVSLCSSEMVSLSLTVSAETTCSCTHRSTSRAKLTV